MCVRCFQGTWIWCVIAGYATALRSRQVIAGCPVIGLSLRRLWKPFIDAETCSTERPCRFLINFLAAPVLETGILHLFCALSPDRNWSRITLQTAVMVYPELILGICSKTTEISVRDCISADYTTFCGLPNWTAAFLVLDTELVYISAEDSSTELSDSMRIDIGFLQWQWRVCPFECEWNLRTCRLIAVLVGHCQCKCALERIFCTVSELPSKFREVNAGVNCVAVHCKAVDAGFVQNLLDLSIDIDKIHFSRDSCGCEVLGIYLEDSRLDTCAWNHADKSVLHFLTLIDSVLTCFAKAASKSDFGCLCSDICRWDCPLFLDNCRAVVNLDTDGQLSGECGSIDIESDEIIRLAFDGLRFKHLPLAVNLGIESETEITCRDESGAGFVLFEGQCIWDVLLVGGYWTNKLLVEFLEIISIIHSNFHVRKSGCSLDCDWSVLGSDGERYLGLVVRGIKAGFQRITIKSIKIVIATIQADFLFSRICISVSVETFTIGFLENFNGKVINFRESLLCLGLHIKIVRPICGQCQRNFCHSGCFFRAWSRARSHCRCYCTQCQ